MSRRTMASAAFLAGLVALGAFAQPPGPGGNAAQPKTKKSSPNAKAADPTDAAIKAALANDADVQVARAKVLLAEAELAKAKQAVVLKVMNLKATIQEQRSTLAAAEDRMAWAARMVEKGQATQHQVLDERAKLESAKAALARFETELKLLTGGGTGESFKGEATFHLIPEENPEVVGRGVLWLSRSQMLRDQKVEFDSAVVQAVSGFARLHLVKGPVPDRLRAALDKSVKLGAKEEKVTFEKALDIFKKEAGLDVSVRYGANTGSVGDISSEGEELPIGAWFQLFEDARGSGHFYVRDYGLLFAHKSTAPPDAPTLTEFWKQKLPDAREPKEGTEPGKRPGR